MFGFIDVILLFVAFTLISSFVRVLELLVTGYISKKQLKEKIESGIGSAVIGFKKALEDRGQGNV